MLWLDLKIFGNGYGLRAPAGDQKFYFLSGRFYTWSGWFGSQLQSFEWFTPKPGTKRKIAGKIFTVFQTERRWLRVRASWAWDDLPRDINEGNEALRKLQRELDYV